MKVFNNQEDLKIDKLTKKKWNIANIIGWILLLEGVVMYQSSIIWMFIDDDTDKWFSRASIGLICFGFAGVIFKLRK